MEAKASTEDAQSHPVFSSLPMIYFFLLVCFFNVLIYHWIRSKTILKHMQRTQKDQPSLPDLAG